MMVVVVVVVVSPVIRPQITDTVIAGQTTTTIYIITGTSCPLQLSTIMADDSDTYIKYIH